jgi:hypothetical protein
LKRAVHSLLTFVFITAALTAAVAALAWIFRRAMRTAKRGVPGAGSIGWALLFLTSGRMPPPPPASQIEQELNTRKDRLASRQDDDL